MNVSKTQLHWNLDLPNVPSTLIYFFRTGTTIVSLVFIQWSRLFETKLATMKKTDNVISLCHLSIQNCDDLGIAVASSQAGQVLDQFLVTQLAHVDFELAT